MFADQSWHLWRNKRSAAGGVPYIWNARDQTWGTDNDPEMSFPISHSEMEREYEYQKPCSSPST